MRLAFRLVVVGVAGGVLAGACAAFAASSWPVHGTRLDALNTARLGLHDNLLKRTIRAFGEPGDATWNLRGVWCEYAFRQRGVTVKYAGCWNPGTASGDLSSDFGARCFWKATMTAARWAVTGISTNKRAVLRVGMSERAVNRTFRGGMVSFDDGRSWSLGFIAPRRRVSARFRKGRVVAVIVSETRVETKDEAVGFFLGCGV